MTAKKASGKVRRTRYTDYERWVGLPHWMLNSTAWQLLSPNAVKQLIEVWRRYNGVNNGEISYSVREAAGIGLHRNKAGRALQELVDSGFLKVARDSSFTVKTREARLWTITALPMPNGTPATKEFMGGKFRTQSHQRDRQSHPRDREPENDPKTAATVPPKGLSGPVSPLPQSRWRDTSNYHAASLWLAGSSGAEPSTSAATRSPAPGRLLPFRKARA